MGLELGFRLGLGFGFGLGLLLVRSAHEAPRLRLVARAEEMSRAEMRLLARAVLMSATDISDSGRQRPERAPEPTPRPEPG